MLTGTNLTYTKEFNLRIVHETVRLFGPLSRADIARRTELTAQTVSNLVRDLIARNLIVESAKLQSGRGAPSTALSLNPDGAYSIGLDLDRDHLTGVLVDLAGVVRKRIHHELAFPSPEEALKLMVDTAQQLTWKQGLQRSQICGVGVGVPGPMYLADDGSYLVNPRAFEGWQDVPMEALLSEKLQVPVFLENNATAAAVGERWYGEGRHIPTFFYIYFGSGLGGGIVINGQPFEGAAGNAGELGYLPTPVSERTGDRAQTRPHVGEHFNLPRLYRLLREEGLQATTPEDLRSLLIAEHPSLIAWIDKAAEHLSWEVLAIEYLINPSAVFFGGRLAVEVLEALRLQVAEKLPDLRIDETPSAPEYRVATAGVDAAALGVATLPIYELFAPTHNVLSKQGDGDAGRSSLRRKHSNSK